MIFFFCGNLVPIKPQVPFHKMLGLSHVICVQAAMEIKKNEHRMSQVTRLAAVRHVEQTSCKAQLLQKCAA